MRRTIIEIIETVGMGLAVAWWLAYILGFLS